MTATETPSDLRSLAADAWAWRAAQQPALGDDIPRLPRPAGWLPDFSPPPSIRPAVAATSCSRRWRSIDASGLTVAEQVDHRLARLDALPGDVGARRDRELAPRPPVPRPPGAQPVLRPAAPAPAVRRRAIERDRRRARRTSLAPSIRRPLALDRPAGPLTAAALEQLDGVGDRLAESVTALAGELPEPHRRPLLDGLPPARDALATARRLPRRSARPARRGVGRRGRVRLVPAQRRRHGRDARRAAPQRTTGVGAGGRVGGRRQAPGRVGAGAADAGQRRRAGRRRGGGGAAGALVLRRQRLPQPTGEPAALPHRRDSRLPRAAAVPRRLRRPHRRAPAGPGRRVVHAGAATGPAVLLRRQRPGHACGNRPRGRALPAARAGQRPRGSDQASLLRLGPERGDRLLQRGVPAAGRAVRRRTAHARGDLELRPIAVVAGRGRRAAGDRDDDARRGGRLLRAPGADGPRRRRSRSPASTPATLGSPSRTRRASCSS